MTTQEAKAETGSSAQGSQATTSVPATDASDEKKKDSEPKGYFLPEETIVIVLEEATVKKITDYNSKYKTAIEAYAAKIKEYNESGRDGSYDKTELEKKREELRNALVTDGKLNVDNKITHLNFFTLIDMKTQDVLLAPRVILQDVVDAKNTFNAVGLIDLFSADDTVEIKRDSSGFLDKFEGLKDKSLADLAGISLDGSKLTFNTPKKLIEEYTQFAKTESVEVSGQVSILALMPPVMMAFARDSELVKNVDNTIKKFNEEFYWDTDDRGDRKKKVVEKVEEISKNKGTKLTHANWGEVEALSAQLWEKIEENPIGKFWPEDLATVPSVLDGALAELKQQDQQQTGGFGAGASNSSNIGSIPREVKPIDHILEKVKSAGLPSRMFQATADVALMRYTANASATANVNLLEGNASISASAGASFNLAEAKGTALVQLPHSRGLSTKFEFEASEWRHEYSVDVAPIHTSQPIFKPFSCELLASGALVLASMAKSMKENENISSQIQSLTASDQKALRIGYNSVYESEARLSPQALEKLREFRGKVIHAFLSDGSAKEWLSGIDEINDTYRDYKNNLLTTLQYEHQQRVQPWCIDAYYQRLQNSNQPLPSISDRGFRGSLFAELAEPGLNEYYAGLRQLDYATLVLEMNPPVAPSPLGSEGACFEDKRPVLAPGSDPLLMEYSVKAGDSLTALSKEFGVPLDSWLSAWRKVPNLESIHSIGINDRIVISKTPDDLFYINYLPKGDQSRGILPMAPDVEVLTEALFKELGNSFKLPDAGISEDLKLRHYVELVNYARSSGLILNRDRVSLIMSFGHAQGGAWSEEKVKHAVSAGFFRLDLEFGISGNIGVNLALSANVNINSGFPTKEFLGDKTEPMGTRDVNIGLREKDKFGNQVGGSQIRRGTVHVTPMIDLNENLMSDNKKKAYAQASADAFAGAQGNASAKGSLMWLPPEFKADGSLDTDQQADEEKFVSLASVGVIGTAAAGIGGSANFAIGYDNDTRKFIVAAKAKLVVGVGAGGEFTSAIDVENIVNFFKLVYEQLLTCDFRVADIFVGSDDGSVSAQQVYDNYCGAFWGLATKTNIFAYGVDYILTATGLDDEVSGFVSELPSKLLDGVQRLSEEFILRFHSVVDDLVSIYEEYKDAEEVPPFKYAPPEVLGSWLYQLLNAEWHEEIEFSLDHKKDLELTMLCLLEKGIQTRREFNEVLEHCIEKQIYAAGRTAEQKYTTAVHAANQIGNFLNDSEDRKALKEWFAKLTKPVTNEPLVPVDDDWLKLEKIEVKPVPGFYWGYQPTEVFRLIKADRQVPEGATVKD